MIFAPAARVRSIRSAAAPKANLQHLFAENGAIPTGLRVGFARVPCDPDHGNGLSNVLSKRQVAVTRLPKEDAMIALRLVRLIEAHSEQLSSSLLKKLQASPRTQGLRQVPAGELHDRTHEVYRNLSDWLLHMKERDIERCYFDLGMRRALQGVPLTDLCWVLVLTKEHLWHFLEEQGFLRSSMEILGELELLRLLDQFFDHAICFAAMGYQHATMAAAA